MGTQLSTATLNTLTITKTGRINLSGHFVKKYGFKKDMRVALYWDDSECRMALAIAEKDRPGSFPLVQTPNGQTAYVVAIQFFRSHGLDPEKYAKRYSFEVAQPNQLGIDGKHEVFVIDLKESVR